LGTVEAVGPGAAALPHHACGRHRARPSGEGERGGGYLDGCPTEENGDTVALHPLDLEAAEGEVLG
jgi:hypothetical protein